jgi:light-regulated signal transduction histidine kinase (bacteriophytochrome)
VLNPLLGGFTDLTDSNLRSVAGVHLEYLRNMNVMASMSTRIIKEDRLWGLISCHHRTPKYLSYQMCSLFELLSNIISARVVALEQKEELGFRSDMQGLYARLMEQVYAGDRLTDVLYQQQHGVLKLLAAEGVALVLDGHIHAYGKTPSTLDIEDLIFWLQTNQVTKLYHTAHLAAAFEDAERYAEAVSGLVALPVQPEKGAYILAFRPEVVRQVAWGGNPDNAITFEADGKRYHPRNSFAIWREQVQQQALPWAPEELEVADQFRNFIVEYTLQKMN